MPLPTYLHHAGNPQIAAPVDETVSRSHGRSAAHSHSSANPKVYYYIWPSNPQQYRLKPRPTLGHTWPLACAVAGLRSCSQYRNKYRWRYPGRAPRSGDVRTWHSSLRSKCFRAMRRAVRIFFRFGDAPTIEPPLPLSPHHNRHLSATSCAVLETIFQAIPAERGPAITRLKNGHDSSPFPGGPFEAVFGSIVCSEERIFGFPDAMKPINGASELWHSFG